MMARKKLEPIGHLTFGRAQPVPIVPKVTEATWMMQARLEVALSRRVVPILNASDAELEAMIREDGEGLDAYMTIAETCGSVRKRYEAGADVMKAAENRLLIVLERIVGSEAVCGTEGGSA